MAAPDTPLRIVMDFGPVRTPLFAPPSQQDCTRALRRDGVHILPRSCRVCGLGPCRFDAPPPNRLTGSTLLENGDAT
jgi:hypothetical protein